SSSPSGSRPDGSAKPPPRRVPDPAGTANTSSSTRPRSMPGRRSASRAAATDATASAPPESTDAPKPRRTPCSRSGSGQGDQVEVAVVPQILITVGQKQHPIGIEGRDGSLIVGHEHDRSLIAADRWEDL